MNCRDPAGLFHLHSATTAVRDPGVGIDGFHFSDQFCSDPQRLFEVFRSQPKRACHSGAAFFNHLDLQARNEPQYFQQRQPASHCKRMTRCMPRNFHRQGSEILLQFSTPVQIQQKRARIHSLLSDDFGVIAGQKHGVLLRETQ